MKNSKLLSMLLAVSMVLSLMSAPAFAASAAAAGGAGDPVYDIRVTPAAAPARTYRLTVNYHYYAGLTYVMAALEQEKGHQETYTVTKGEPFTLDFSHMLENDGFSYSFVNGTLTAGGNTGTFNPSYHFDGNTCSFTINADRNGMTLDLAINLWRPTYTVQFSTEEGGSIDGGANPISYPVLNAGFDFSKDIYGFDPGADFPAVPKAEPDAGYSFAGWYQDGQKVADFPAAVTESTSYVAKWTRNPTAVSVWHFYGDTDPVADAANGTPALTFDRDSRDLDDAFVRAFITPEEQTPEGRYCFVGYEVNVRRDGASDWEQIFDLDSALDLTDASGVNIHLKYDDIRTVTFHYLELDGRWTQSAVKVPYGNSADEPDEVPKLISAGKTLKFLGWDADFSRITGDLDVTANYARGFFKQSWVIPEEGDPAIRFVQFSDSADQALYVETVFVTAGETVAVTVPESGIYVETPGTSVKLVVDHMVIPTKNGEIVVDGPSATLTVQQAEAMLEAGTSFIKVYWRADTEPPVEPTDPPVVDPTDPPVVDPTDPPVVDPTAPPVVPDDDDDDDDDYNPVRPGRDPQPEEPEVEIPDNETPLSPEPDEDGKEIEITDQEPPLSGTPDTESGEEVVIEDEKTPLASDPFGGEEPAPETDEIVILDGRTPLGYLPQTGTQTVAADGKRILGAAALVASASLAGAALFLSRKKENEGS